MTGNAESHDHEQKKGITRRTVVQGVAWAAPAIAVAATVPNAAASLLPCVDSIAAVGGTYPVTSPLSGCSGNSSHWDFKFRIDTAPASGTICQDCVTYRIRFFDNPKRSRLWITDDVGWYGDPTSNTANSPRLYIQTDVVPGNSADFPEVNDQVRRVGGSSPWTGFVPSTGVTSPPVLGNIQGPFGGASNDALHVLMLPNGGLPCSATGPMAYYTVSCVKANGSETPLGGIGEINPCVPVIGATACRIRQGFNTIGYRIDTSQVQSCGSPVTVVGVQTSGQSNRPEAAPVTVLWTGSQPVGTSFNTNSATNSAYLWIKFTTDNVNFSYIRVDTPDSGSCTPAANAAARSAAPADEGAAVQDDTPDTLVYFGEEGD